MEYIFTFLEGIASFISPCLLPMLPIYLSYFMGKEEKNLKKAIKNAIGFVIGFTIVFLILSIFASQLGSFISQSISYIKIIFAILIILLGLNSVSYTHLDVYKRQNILLENVEKGM